MKKIFCLLIVLFATNTVFIFAQNVDKKKIFNIITNAKNKNSHIKKKRKKKKVYIKQKKTIIKKKPILSFPKTDINENEKGYFSLRPSSVVLSNKYNKLFDNKFNRIKIKKTIIKPPKKQKIEPKRTFEVKKNKPKLLFLYEE